MFQSNDIGHFLQIPGPVPVIRMLMHVVLQNFERRSVTSLFDLSSPHGSEIKPHFAVISRVVSVMGPVVVMRTIVVMMVVVMSFVPFHSQFPFLFAFLFFFDSGLNVLQLPVSLLSVLHAVDFLHDTAFEFWHELVYQFRWVVLEKRRN